MLLPPSILRLLQGKQQQAFIAIHFRIKSVYGLRYVGYVNLVPKTFDLHVSFVLIFINIISDHKYHSRTEFMHDMELILTNSVRYNGQDSAFTQKAEILLQVTKDSLAEVSTV